MGKIKVLDDLTIQKIAAGEVVERPASIVKELVENSIDANARNITIEIKNGGKSYIRITDDGDGIEENDLKLAFKRHSTSKLSSVEDLYEIKSLGFRGEALSSISNVSKVQVMTKTENSLGGTQAIIEEGEILSTSVVGCPKGTTMIVKDLFYNLPVRKKFLKSDLIESNRISDIVYKIALGNIDTSIKFIRDSKVVLSTSRNNVLNSHIYSVLGKEFAKNLIEVNDGDEDLQIKGYVSNNQLYRSNRSHQYIYINGRFINNISIANAIESHYKTLLPLNRYPVFILFIEIDPGSIDVNIHPTKQEIKFANHDKIMETINSSIKKVVGSSISIPKVKFKKPEVKIEEELPLLFDLNKDNRNKDNGLEENIIIKDFTAKDKPHFNRNDNFHVAESLVDKDYKTITDNLDIKEEEVNKTTKNILLDLEPIGIVFNTYILAEDKINEKFYFIDQHAAHERVMYEKYLNEYKREEIVVQQLMIPEIIELTNSEMTSFLENISLFTSLGFDVEEFGSNSIAIRGVPFIFGIPNVKDLFYDLLDNLGSQINSSYDLKLDKIMKLACVNAIKAGDKIDEIEILSLFDQLKLCENPNTCPHGRPTILEMTKRDIEKEFLRII